MNRPLEVATRAVHLDNQEAFWEAQLADRTNAYVIDGDHYRVGGGGNGMRGHGGRTFHLRILATDELIITDDLWYQGPVPDQWRHLLPDTAEFVPTLPLNGKDDDQP